MSGWALILASLRHYRRTHAGVALGVAIATAVLVGALLVGDSVRHSLRDRAQLRIGRADAVLAVGERLFGASLATRLAPDLDGAATAAALHFQGIASVAGGAARTGIVEIYGVDDRFWALGPGAAAAAPPAPGTAVLNARLAAHLGVAVGDAVLLRVPKPSALPRGVVMATVDDASFAIRVEVGGIRAAADYGDFGLRASQVPPFNVFVALPWLQRELEIEGRANLLLAGANGATPDLVARAQRALRRRWTLDDAQLEVRAVDGAPLAELVSRRIFLEPAVVDAAAALEPDLVGLLTYFVNAIRAGARATPYSMVTALGPVQAPPRSRNPATRALLALLPDGLGDDGIVLNAWCAADLQVGVGDAVTLEYYVLDPDLRLRTGTRTLTVGGVAALAGAAADPSLMPPFPGLEGSADCRDWEPGVPIDLEAIRDVDEQYWDDHRGTPKAFVGLGAGRALWGNRFGATTALRGPAARVRAMAASLPTAFDPAALGFVFRDVRGPADAAGAPATDFGGLFLGLSFFLIAAALILTALLFVFGVEQRARELGTLLAVGLTPRQVRRLFLAEALLIALLGGALGAALGVAYTGGVLWGLGTIWRDAVGATTLALDAPAGTIAGGAAAAVGIAWLAIAVALRRAFRHPAVALLGSRGGLPPGAPPAPRHARASALVAGISLVAAIALAARAGGGAEQAALAFFGAGALVLVAGLAASRALLLRVAVAPPSGLPSVGALGVRNSGRRRGRSTATVALLASGTFLVLGVQAHRLAPPRDATARASGTGGFALFGRSTLPVLRSLDTELGRETYGLDGGALDGVEIVPMQVREGDDASCLNLSVPQTPRLLGVPPGALAARGAFRFAQVLDELDGDLDPARAWKLLDGGDDPEVVPGIADQASVMWTMHKQLGDRLRYRDENGAEFDVRLVATVADSILQGNVLIAERHFRARFPSASGAQMFLIDAPPDRVAGVTAALSRGLEDLGLEVTPTADRLRAFQAVQNTYLLIFQALGGLGLLLGSAGLGMVVLRNTLERRGELAIVHAVGLRKATVRRIVWVEHGLLLALGLAVGCAAAGVALWPGLRDGGLAWLPVTLLLVGIALSGAAWVGLATALATRGRLLDGLRDDF